MKLFIPILFISLLVLSSVSVAADDLSLSLRQREDTSGRVLDILVTNTSTSSVRIVSEGIAPPWSVWAWFAWEVDGKPAKYLENVAGIPKTRSVWEVPRNGTILWATIPLQSLQHAIQNERREKEVRSVIDDTVPHFIRILPSDRWKDIAVSFGTLEVGAKKTEKGGTEQPATRPESKSEGSDRPQPESEGRSR
jgi:hypothetical protein